MKLALLSDLHANLQAVQACVAHARAQGADRLALLGDLVGYGPQPAEVVDLVQRLADEGAVVLQGNHDAMAVSPPADASTHGSATAAWTAAQLSDAQRHYLAGLPLVWHGPQLLLVHASADRPERWRYVEDERSASASLDAAQHHHARLCIVFHALANPAKGHDGFRIQRVHHRRPVESDGGHAIGHGGEQGAGVRAIVRAGAAHCDGSVGGGHVAKLKLENRLSGIRFELVRAQATELQIQCPCSHHFANQQSRENPDARCPPSAQG